MFPLKPLLYYIEKEFSMESQIRDTDGGGGGRGRWRGTLMSIE
jgi:hypothetical protein